ncbi:4'-phosphopantetheinyl transferase family protein [Geodermatophilus sp. SYSU D00079]
MDVWQVRLDVTDDQLAGAAAVLTAGERASADRGAPPVRRRRIALRAALRTVLAQVLGRAPEDVPLVTDPSGRPRLDLPAPLWDVNCSRSDDLGLVVLARGLRVGIDVERISPWTGATAQEGWLSPSEVSAVQALPPAERARAAARSWTQKEAVLKAQGTGLSTPPAGVTVSRDRRGTRSGPWTLAAVAVPPAYEASLACSAPVPLDGPALVPLLLPDPARPTGHRRDTHRPH